MLAVASFFIALAALHVPSADADPSTPTWKPPLVLVGKVDSVRGGIRTTFDALPDAPVSKFTIEMRGGSKGLLVNSTNLCKARWRADVQIKGQNARSADHRPLLQNSCPKTAGKNQGQRENK